MRDMPMKEFLATHQSLHSIHNSYPYLYSNPIPASMHSTPGMSYGVWTLAPVLPLGAR